MLEKPFIYNSKKGGNSKKFLARNDLMSSGSQVGIKANRDEQGGTSTSPLNLLSIQNQSETGRGSCLNFVASQLLN